MVFIIRVQTKAGTKRLLFKDDTVTWKDLQNQVTRCVALAVDVSDVHSLSGQGRVWREPRRPAAVENSAQCALIC